jgi:hypothetical protein
MATAEALALIKAAQGKGEVVGAKVLVLVVLAVGHLTPAGQQVQVLRATPCLLANRSMRG